MTDTQKEDIKMLGFFALALIAASFVVGVYDGLDRAMAAQERRNRLSVYCQQVGAIETLCAGLKDGSL